MTINAPWHGQLDAVWSEIEAWYAQRHASHLLNGPASLDEIARAEAKLGVRFPEQLRASLARHNGTRVGGWTFGTLLPLAGIIGATELWRKMAQHRTAPVVLDAPRGPLLPGWWLRGWVAIEEDATGHGTAIDTVPGPAGHSGQLVDMDAEAGPRAGLPDIVSLLRDVRVELDDFRVVDGDALEEHEVWDGDPDLVPDPVAGFADEDAELEAERRARRVIGR